MASTADKSGGPRTVKRVSRKKASISSGTVESQASEDVVVRNEEETPVAGRALLRGSVRGSDVTSFMRQLIMLLEAGTPILKALRTLSQRGQTVAARALVADIAAYVEAGNPLWQAFDRHPRYFNSVEVNLIRASEASGTLVVVLRRMVKYREERELLRKRVRSAMIYPIILVLACFAIMALLTTLVIPQFKDMFEKAGILETAPAITRWFLSAADWFLPTFWIPIVVVLVLIAIYKFWVSRSPLARMRADRIKIRLPIAGKILHKHALVELTRTLSLLLRSGLSMMATLELTRKAISNKAVAQSLQDVRDSVERGEGMEPPLRQNSRVIPPVVADMLVTGEESGRVDLICEQVADIYEEEVKIHVNTLSETLQPVFTVIIGGVVLFLFIALFLPLVSMIENISAANI